MEQNTYEIKVRFLKWVKTFTDRDPDSATKMEATDKMWRLGVKTTEESQKLIGEAIEDGWIVVDYPEVWLKPGPRPTYYRLTQAGREELAKHL